MNYHFKALTKRTGDVFFVGLKGCTNPERNRNSSTEKVNSHHEAKSMWTPNQYTHIWTMPQTVRGNTNKQNRDVQKTRTSGQVFKNFWP